MRVLFISIIITSILSVSCKTEELKSLNSNTLVGEKNFLSGYEPINPDKSLNVVIEIPAGTIDKWEVNKESGNMNWEIRNGKPRKVNYLGYPANYGMIPKTLLPKELGGDGDPLDVLILGPAVDRGTIVKAKLIGVLKLLDRGEQDDKLIAVMEGSIFYEVNSLKELDNSFKGVSTIIETFFSNYKGPGKMESQGFSENDEAKKILNNAIDEYKK